MDRKDPVTKAIYQLEKAHESNDVIFAIRVCTVLKRSGAKPTVQIYRLLMQLFMEKNMHLETIAAFDDALSLGIEPDKEMWNCLLQVSPIHPQGLSSTRMSCRPAPEAFSRSPRPCPTCLMPDKSQMPAAIEPSWSTTPILETWSCAYEHCKR